MGVPLQICAECYWEALEKFSSNNPNSYLKNIYFVVDNSTIVTTIHDVMKRKWLEGKAAISLGSSGGGGGSRRHTGNSNKPSTSQVTLPFIVELWLSLLALDFF